MLQITRTRRGVHAIVEHLGSGHSDAQPAALVAITPGRIDEINGQEQLGLSR